MKTAIKVILAGHVQGVMCRDFVQRKATLLGIVGEVENMPDGTVRVYAEGEKSALEKLIGFVRTGPALARIDSADIQWVEPAGSFESFFIRY